MKRVAFMIYLNTDSDSSGLETLKSIQTKLGAAIDDAIPGAISSVIIAPNEFQIRDRPSRTNRGFER